MYEVMYPQAFEQAQQIQQKILGSLPKELIAEEDALPFVIRQYKKKDSLKALRALYEFSNRINEMFLMFLACGKGCSACCSLKQIQIFELEALYIEKVTGKKRRNSPLLSSDIENQACPFLTDGCCNIYNHRPYACRKHFSMVSSMWCQHDVPDSFEFPMIVFDGIERGLFALAHRSGKSRILDIRQVFEG